MPIHPDMMVYKNKIEKKPQFITQSNHHTAKSHETFIGLNLHTGTHIDAPLHMIKDGNTIESYPLDAFLGTCKVLDFTHVESGITKKDLETKNITQNDFILLKTKNSFYDTFDFSFVYLAKDGAEYLASKNIRGVGIDALGIERNQEHHPTHKILLGQPIIIIEGLRLKNASEKTYQLIALPLHILGVEAALTRAILIEE